MRKAFLVCAVVELVYKFNEKSTRSDLKGKLIAKVSFKLFLGSHIYIHINKYHRTPARTSACRVKNVFINNKFVSTN